ncbi:dolichyl pyrophosphate Man9GlcNAc2 alpha-1,3-glucosyltransferase [Danaus plexippus]|uniref:dolichyl pyrophosphate Man9GlcNAc2 alpha-1,3-glucosyltransferase n=1 Tax=Danaus plexippus TaxID=13037 RepID=UPI002AB00575|nr:dolichyl pyrophosphate Man9GlcNAc2 alpha-1,3-glucosyltransferase [Danaus plexippus]
MGKRADSDKAITKYTLYPGVFFACLVRWCVAAYPYSGYKKPPMYGDFEAQRHWQEITVHTQISSWYHNTTQNDLEYWGLDYPPLTAYHSLLMGLIADWLDPESVRLFASRGYENEFHKSFMRWTVFLCDVYFFFTAAACISIDRERMKPKLNYNIFKHTDIRLVMFLLYPGIIVIDHGHFQYNCVSLGLFLWATFFTVSIQNDILSTIFFVLAINYKQMELYHALPFFFYLLRKCFIVSNKGNLFQFVKKLSKIGIAVIFTFVLVWYPMLSSWDNILQILHRLFPLKRGVFEDKVSNVWCTVNNFIKLKHLYKNEEMVRMCLLSTVLAAAPSCLDLFFRINVKKFVLSLINVSLAFFLFSYQVHEKSILLVAIPVAIHFPEDPFICFWFLLVSNFSMLPLLLKDGLLIPFISTNLIYIGFHSISLQLSCLCKTGPFSFLNANTVNKCINPAPNRNAFLLKMLTISFFLSLLGMLLLILVTLFVEPPSKYPDLFPVLISMYSCAHFVYFFFYFTHKQLMLPTSLPTKAKVKLN